MTSVSFMLTIPCACDTPSDLIRPTQIMQDYIPDGIRGIVGGVQQSLNAFFGLVSFAIGVIVPDPDDFYIYVAAGYGSVGLAVLCYTFGIFIRRDKLGDHGECS